MYMTWFSLNPLSPFVFLTISALEHGELKLEGRRYGRRKGEKSGTEAKPTKIHGITDMNVSRPSTRRRRKRNRGKAGTNSRNYGYARLRARNASQLRAR